MQNCSARVENLNYQIQWTTVTRSYTYETGDW